MTFSCPTSTYITYFMQIFKSRKISFIPQWIASIGVMLLFMQLGFITGCVSPMLAKLTGPNSPIALNQEEASWMASLVNIGRFCGAIVGSLVTVHFGTKNAILATSIPIALGWLGIAIAESVEILYIARLLSGVGAGMAFSCFPSYLGEIAMPEVRGALVSLATCGGPTGLLLGSIISNYLSIGVSACVYLTFCIWLMALFLYLPESPHHLIKIGNRKKAEMSINWYRSGKGTQEELESLEKFMASEKTITFINRLREFKNSDVRKITYHVMILFTFMQICGLNSIVFYLEIIMRRAKNSRAAEIVIFINICATIGALFSMLLIDRCGRRFLLLTSSIGVTISMFSMMSYFFIIDVDLDVTNLQWLPIASMISFMFFFFIGLNSVPSTVSSEIIPSNVKCIVSCLGSLTAGIIAFLSSKSYQPLVNFVGEAYMFLIYGLFALSVIPYVLFAMPETKGKSLREIQDELTKK
ncbi:facilitated trehalose transporter Tret1-like [Phymastichus coffea]|uniref:facilitated trehalose transporter Tret1-like n=1 Tax=Phymastichus coffea TaxID=108790 RepID=UPI00273AC79C|nr:facilitated trehalose transporter Tret1-like [Phymastichus coffea]